MCSNRKVNPATKKYSQNISATNMDSQSKKFAIKYMSIKPGMEKKLLLILQKHFTHIPTQGKEIIPLFT